MISGFGAVAAPEQRRDQTVCGAVRHATDSDEVAGVDEIRELFEHHAVFGEPAESASVGHKCLAAQRRDPRARRRDRGKRRVDVCAGIIISGIEQGLKPEAAGDFVKAGPGIRRYSGILDGR